jgi:TPR repeat protein
LLKEAAERGVPQAQCEYAEAVKDEKPLEAEGFLRKAFVRDSSTAQLWFARVHFQSVDRYKGKSLMKRVAYQGNVEAQFETGKGVLSTSLGRAEFDEAIGFLRRAADAR